jgi:hypothetical protein
LAGYITRPIASRTLTSKVIEAHTQSLVISVEYFDTAEDADECTSPNMVSGILAHYIMLNAINSLFLSSVTMFKLLMRQMKATRRHCVYLVNIEMGNGLFVAPRAQEKQRNRLTQSMMKNSRLQARRDLHQQYRWPDFFERSSVSSLSTSG